MRRLLPLLAGTVAVLLICMGGFLLTRFITNRMTERAVLSFTAGEEKKITKVVVEDDIAYVAMEKADTSWYDAFTVHIFNLEKPETPYLIHTISLAHAPTYLLLRDSLLYVTSGFMPGRLYVFDVSNPAKPVRLDEYGLTCGCRIQVADGKAYIADHYSGLRILDVSTPTSVEWLGGFAPPHRNDRLRARDNFITWTATGVAVHGNIVYLQMIDTGVGQRTYILDVSDPSAPREIGMVEDDSKEARSTTYSVEQYDDVMYISTKTGVEIHGISPQPTLKASFDFATLSGAESAAITFVTGHHLYVLSQETGLRILDIADYDDIKMLGTYTAIRTPAQDLWVDNGIALIADQERGLQILDVRTPEQIKVLFPHE